MTDVIFIICKKRIDLIKCLQDTYISTKEVAYAIIKRLCSFTYLLAPKLKPPVRPVVAGALEGVPNENDIVLWC